MEVKPIHILGASVVAFFTIIAANVLVTWRSNSEFRDKWKNLAPAKLTAIRERRVAEEQMTTDIPESN